MGKLKDKIQNIKMPHTYVILTMILFDGGGAHLYYTCGGSTTGSHDPVSNKMIVIPESFHFTQGGQAGLL